MEDIGKALKTEKLHFYKRYLHLQGKSPYVIVSSSLYQEEKDDSKSLETVINEEGRDLNLYNYTLFYCVLPDNLLQLLPLPSWHQLEIVCKVVVSAILESYLVFLVLSHVYNKHIAKNLER